MKENMETNKDENHISIPVSEYEKLKEAQKILAALEDAGVDNWEGYDYAMDMVD